MAPVELGRLPAVLLFLAERLADHVAADEREQRNAVLMTSTGRTRVTVNPFPIETAKASMATDTEISSISIIAGT